MLRYPFYTLLQRLLLDLKGLVSCVVSIVMGLGIYFYWCYSSMENAGTDRTFSWRNRKFFYFFPVLPAVAGGGHAFIILFLSRKG